MPSPNAAPPQAEAQQTHGPFHGMQGGVGQGAAMAAPEQRQMPQPLRELSAPRMPGPRFPPPQQPKPDSEPKAGAVDRLTAQDGGSAPGERAPTPAPAPASLNQVLDNSGAAKAAPRPAPRPAQGGAVRDAAGKEGPKSALDPERPPCGAAQSAAATTAAVNVSEAKPKPAVPIPNVTSVTTLSQNPISSIAVHHSPNVNPTPTGGPVLGATASGSPRPAVAPGQSGPALAVGAGSNSGSAPKPNPSLKPVRSVHSVIQIDPPPVALLEVSSPFFP